MSDPVKHISVCICTYKRPGLLTRLLRALGTQETDGQFTYSIVVVDNDSLRSAESTVSEFAASSPIPVTYCVQLHQNVQLTRNKALENASGDFVAFIDDDEFPTERWLLTLLEACNQYKVDGVLGPVKPYFDGDVPNWVVKGRFYDRPTYPTGYVITWEKGRTGNVLFRRRILVPGEQSFRPQFQGGGGDQDFFRRMIEKGHVFIWCDEAVAYEVQSPIRWRRSFMLRRALLRGWASRLHPTFGVRDVLRSVIAVPAYTVALPFALALGQHRFMHLLISLCDHLGKLLGVAGIRPIRQAYVTD